MFAYTIYGFVRRWMTINQPTAVGLEPISLVLETSILPIELSPHTIGNIIYHLILPYLCIYTIAETHLVLCSHSFLVIVQVQGECRSP